MVGNGVCGKIFCTPIWIWYDLLHIGSVDSFYDTYEGHDGHVAVY